MCAAAVVGSRRVVVDVEPGSCIFGQGSCCCLVPAPTAEAVGMVTAAASAAASASFVGPFNV